MFKIWNINVGDWDIIINGNYVNWNIIQGNGIIKTKEISLNNNSFSTINNIGSITVVVSNSDSNNKIEIEAESNLLEYIELNNKYWTLEIKIKDDISFSSKFWIKVYIYTNNNIENLKQIWSWDIIVKDIKNEEILNVEVSWSWDIILEWNFCIWDLDCNVNGSWGIDVSNNIIVEEANIIVNWSWDITIWNVKETNIIINGSWDVQVWEDTNILNSVINGSWDISRM